jgi:hypothetical protein
MARCLGTEPSMEGVAVGWLYSQAVRPGLTHANTGGVTPHQLPASTIGHSRSSLNPLPTRARCTGHRGSTTATNGTADTTAGLRHGTLSRCAGRHDRQFLTRVATIVRTAKARSDPIPADNHERHHQGAAFDTQGRRDLLLARRSLKPSTCMARIAHGSSGRGARSAGCGLRWARCSSASGAANTPGRTRRRRCQQQRLGWVMPSLINLST